MLEHERWLKIVKEDLAAAKVLLKAEALFLGCLPQSASR